VLVAANTMAMSIRERTGEIAILKTLGFSPTTVLAIIVGEAIVIGAAGGLGGSLAAKLLFGAVDLGGLTGGFLSGFTVGWDTILMSLGIALVVAIISTSVPAWTASQFAIADAMRRRGE
jgi:putative ABC transport system permease protein